MKSKITILCLFLMLAFLNNNLYAQWQPVGSVAFSAGQVSFTTIAVDQGGTPYIAYQDLQNNDGITVKKYNGSAWVTVGTAGFSAGAATYISLAIDSASGTPYVAYQDSVNSSSVTVEKFNGSNWVVVDTVGFTGNEADYTSLAIGSDGTPYVAFKDWNNNFGLTVAKFNGTHFTTVGTAGFSPGAVDYVSLAIDRTTGTLLVAYEDGAAPSNQVSVDKFNGSNWVAVGSTGFSQSSSTYVSLAIDNSGTPYVAFSDFGSTPGYAANVMKFNGSSWVSVGLPGFSTGEADYTSIAINKNGVPYVIYSDADNTGKAMVQAFNGTTWVTVGSADFSSSGTDYTSIAIDQHNKIYAGYDDYGNSHTATVMEYQAPNGIKAVSSVSDIRVYPNPNNGLFELQLQSSREEEVQVSVFDLTGQLISNYKPMAVNGTFTTDMNAQNLAKGVYILQVRTTDGVENRKLDIE